MKSPPSGKQTPSERVHRQPSPRAEDPIFNIQGFIPTLLEGGLNDPEINRKFLLKAAKNVDRMAGLLEDLDVITKMESGTLTRVGALRLAGNHPRDDGEPRAQGEEERDRFELKKGFDASQIMVKCDRPRLSKSSPTSSSIRSITVGEGHTDIRYYDADDAILVEVATTASASASRTWRVFERFYRVDNRATRGRIGC